MCGIVGYIGHSEAAPIILDSLRKLEYRGYDSAGIAVFDGENINIVKAPGKLDCLVEKTEGGKALKGTCGIGHTRWATHGEPSENNAHPHCNDDRTIVAVHNGIIENYLEQKEKLTRRGYTFYSETDTEVATKLVDYYYKKYKDPIRALANFVLKVRGSYALAVIFADRADEIYAVRKDSPMILGVTEGESFLASDVPAILKYTRNVYYIDNGEIACLKRGKVDFYNLDGESQEKSVTKITWDAETAEKGGYPHFMLKEMHEQPKVIRDTLNSFLKKGKINFSEAGLTNREIKKFSGIVIAACGSAYHVAVVMQYVVESMVRIPVRVELASEFRYRDPVLDKSQLFIVISQSGETADSLAALRLAKEHKLTTLAIVNVVGATIAREADKVLYTKAGPEISVATTKAYSAQLIVCYLLALQFAAVNKTIAAERYSELIAELLALPDKVEEVLSKKKSIQRFAASVANKKDVFFIGRGIDYAICLEGSLKLKEISYMHSEAYAAGELKHGTISLIEKGTLVIAMVTQPQTAEKTVSNLEETRSRGALTVSFSFDGKCAAEGIKFGFPRTEPCFAASLAVVPLQLFAYYMSVLRGNDVDKPRNLAKSVTVE